MTNPRNPDHSIVDDDVAGHGMGTAEVQPPRDDDVEGHAFSARPEVRDDGDVEGHVYVRPEDQSREG